MAYRDYFYRTGILALLSSGVPGTEDRLVAGGHYAYVRHPQYTGLFIALFGEGVVRWPTLFSDALFPVIVPIYVWLAYREDQQEIARFGDTYREYQRQVPMFIPPWGQWRRLANVSQDLNDNRDSR